MSYRKFGPFLYADVLVMHGKLLMEDQKYQRVFGNIFKKVKEWAH
jgi:hypothetical protein